MTDQAPKLAEVQWKFRRIFAFSATLLNALLILAVLHKLNDPGSLRALGLALVALNAFIVLGYLLGATATDVMRIILAWRTTTTVNRSETET